MNEYLVCLLGDRRGEARHYHNCVPVYRDGFTYVTVRADSPAQAERLCRAYAAVVSSTEIQLGNP